MMGYSLRSEIDDPIAYAVVDQRKFRLLRLSLVDLTVAVPPNTFLPGQQITCTFEGAPPAVAEVASASRSEATLQLIEPPLQTARAIAAFCGRLSANGLLPAESFEILEREVLSSSVRVRDALRYLFGERSTATFRWSVDGRDFAGRATAARLEPEARLPLQWEPEEGWPVAPCQVEIDGYVCRFDFCATEIANVDGFIAMAVPSELTRMRHRKQHRFTAPASVEVAFRHPLWPEIEVRRPICDLSTDGVGIVTSRTKDLLFPGLALPVAIIWQNRFRCELQAEVRHLSNNLDGEAEVAGLKLLSSVADEDLHWREKSATVIYPNTQKTGSWSEHQWRLLTASGYFGLAQKGSADFVALKSSFTKSMRTLDTAPQLGCNVVWPSSRGIESAYTALRLYSRGAFLYQLARQPGRAPFRFEGRKILRDVQQHVMEHLMDIGALKWLIIWMHEEVRLPRLIMETMAQRYLDSGRTLIERFHVCEGSTGVAPGETFSAYVGAATAEEKEQFIAHLHATRSPLFMEAHDFDADHFDLDQIKKEWAAAGLHRDRQLLVARDQGRAVAACVLETAEPGLHLFNLLDYVRLFELEDSGKNQFGALLECARAHFRSIGRQKFIYYLEGDPAHALAAGLRDLGATDMVLHPTDLIPDCIEHIYEITTTRDMPRLRE